MAGKKKRQQSAAPRKKGPQKTAAAQQQSAPPPEPEEEPARDPAPDEGSRPAAKAAQSAGADPAAEAGPDAPENHETAAPAGGAPAAAADESETDAAGGSVKAAESEPEDAVPEPEAAAPEPAETGNDAAEPEPEAAAPEEAAAGPDEEIGEDDDAEMSEEERRRVAEMTRTVQISLEQIMAAMADADPAAVQAEAEPAGEGPDGKMLADEEALDSEAEPDGDEVPDGEVLPAEAAPAPRRHQGPSLGRRIGRAAGNGVLSLTRWLLLVLFFVALIAAVGIAFLYRGATPDLIPQVTVTLDGQAVQPTAYDWNVPVVNHLFTRNYHGTCSEEAQALGEPVEGIRPELVVTPEAFETALVLKDSDGNELFNGSAFDFAEYTFDKNGTYSAELTVMNRATRFDVNAVEGSQTYDFTFDISLRPSVRLDSSAALQGDIIAVVAAGIPLNDKPKLLCGLENPGFVPAVNGWIAYVPIPIDAEPGEYLFTVKSSRHEQTLHLTVHERAWREKTLYFEDDLHWAYIGLDETPEAVCEALKHNEDKIYWRDEGFAMPYDFDAKTMLDFGTTESVEDGAGTVRRSINVVSEAAEDLYGSPIVAPAAGKVVLAEDLGGARSAEHGTLLPNKTIVIDHGGGIKTVMYNMRSIDVNVGDIVEQGQTIGTCQLTLCMGVWVGEMPVEPTALWQGRCNAVRYY